MPWYAAAAPTTIGEALDAMPEADLPSYQLPMRYEELGELALIDSGPRSATVVAARGARRAAAMAVTRLLDRIHAHCVSENTASARVLERLGRDGWRRMGEQVELKAEPAPTGLPVRRQGKRLLIDA